MLSMRATTVCPRLRSVTVSRGLAPAFLLPRVLGPFCSKAVKGAELLGAMMVWSSIKCVAAGSMTSWALRAAAEQKQFNGQVLYYWQHLQPSPPCTAAIRHIWLQNEPLLGIQMLERLMGGPSHAPKVTFLSIVTFKRTSLEQLVSLLGHSSHLQTQLLFPSFFRLLVPHTILSRLGDCQHQC